MPAPRKKKAAKRDPQILEEPERVAANPLNEALETHFEEYEMSKMPGS